MMVNGERVCVKRAKQKEKEREKVNLDLGLSFVGMLCSNPRLEVVTITRWSAS